MTIKSSGQPPEFVSSSMRVGTLERAPPTSYYTHQDHCTSPLPSQNTWQSHNICTSTTSHQPPHLITSNIALPPSNLLKRKVTKKELELFAKRLRIAARGPKLVFFDPETVALIPQSSLEYFILKERQKTEDEEVEYNKNLIAVKINNLACEWLMVGFYGPPYPSKKKKAWENLMALLEAHNGPWMCFGDFNFVLNESKALGGKKGSSSTNFLKDLMFEVGATDLGYSGENTLGRKVNGEMPQLKEDWTEELQTSPGGLHIRKLHYPISACHWAATRDALKKWNKEVFGKCQDRINGIMRRIKDIQMKALWAIKSSLIDPCGNLSDWDQGDPWHNLPYM
ncbi:hypothetical protein CFP56_010610 [Quercus suber]|uniref:Uncharacterized protein n=1 Tax=Quercus suber TaxID=58331 RepID=A0AAW0L1L1_QUESU